MDYTPRTRLESLEDSAYERLVFAAHHELRDAWRVVRSAEAFDAAQPFGSRSPVWSAPWPAKVRTLGEIISAAVQEDPAHESALFVLVAAAARGDDVKAAALALLDKVCATYATGQVTPADGAAAAEDEAGGTERTARDSHELFVSEARQARPAGEVRA